MSHRPPPPDQVKPLSDNVFIPERGKASMTAERLLVIVILVILAVFLAERLL